MFKKKQLARKQQLYVRIFGSVMSVHTKSKAPATWDANLLGCCVRSVGRRSMTLALASGLSVHISIEKSSSSRDEWIRAVQLASSRSLQSTYDLGDKVGDGASAIVRKAVHKQSKNCVAVKTIAKRQFDATMARELDREVLASTKIQIPGMIRTHEVFNTQDKVHLIMDLMVGGTLKDRVQAVGGRVPEAVVCPIIYDTLYTLAHLHRIGVVHRDVKLENVLCQTATLPTPKTLLCDFGYVNFAVPGAEVMRSLVGTPVYVAPEIVNGRAYGAAVDVYAVGVMAYRMISGEYPFDGREDDEKTMELIRQGRLEFNSARWANVSQTCRRFVTALLQPDSRKRLTAAAALEHDWFHQCGVVAAQNRSFDIENNAKPKTKSPASVISAASPDDVGTRASELEATFASANQAGDGRYTRTGVGAQGGVNGVRFRRRSIRSYSAKEKFRVLTCMIIFKTRLELNAGLRKQLKASPVKIDPALHPAQHMPIIMPGSNGPTPKPASRTVSSPVVDDVTMSDASQAMMVERAASHPGDVSSSNTESIPSIQTPDRSNLDRQPSRSRENARKQTRQGLEPGALSRAISMRSSRVAEDSNLGLPRFRSFRVSAHSPKSRASRSARSAVGSPEKPSQIRSSNMNEAAA